MYTIGIDVGGMTIKIGLVDDEGVIAKQVRFKTANTSNECIDDMVKSISALLEELESPNYSVKNIRDKLFSWYKNKFDLEHVYAGDLFYNSNETLNEEDKKLCNGIGNMVVLERNINRSIGKKCFEDKKTAKNGYKESEFVSVQNIIKREKWTIDDIKTRANEQYEKIKQFMFEY
jgi:hypothetical protein